jgi:phosphate-selective porin OprO/OprP
VKRIRPALLVLYSLLATGASAAQAPADNEGPADLVIRNVYLLGRQRSAEDRLVNIVILDGKLRLVTQSEVPPDTAGMSVDAEQGFLMGSLIIGSPPRLVILDQDPRDDFEVFLNTAAHIRFAMRGRGRYYDSRKWNRFDSRYISGLVNGALVLDRLKWLSQDSASESQFGDLTQTEGGEIRALRLGVVGGLKFERPWTTDDFVLFDYRLDIPLRGTANLSIGKQKEPISMERLMPLTFVGRATWLPVITADESHLLHLGFGLRHSSAAETNRYRAQPEFDQAPFFLDTGVFAAEGSLTSNVEAHWRRGPYWVGFEYTRADIDAPQVDDPSFSGFHISGTWALTGEMRSYRKTSGIFDPLPVAQSVTQGGWGAWEVGFRYSTLDLDDGGVNGGEMEIYSLGLNWWLTRWSQFSLNFRLIDVDRDGLLGRSSGLNGRLILVLD